MKEQKRGIVSLIRGDNRYDIVLRALNEIADTVELGDARQVLVKPNMVSPDRQLVSSHVDGVRALLDFLRDKGAGHIVIAEYAGAASAMDAYRNFGYLSLLDEYDVELIDLAQEDWIDASICSSALEQLPAKIARRVVESDFRVSLAPIKTHNSMTVTLSLKNMVMGAMRDRCFFHQGWPAMHLTLYGLAPLVAPHLAVLDGFVGVEGESPDAGDPVDSRVAVASSDWLAADTIGTLVMDHDPLQIGYLVYSQRGGLGEGDTGKIQLRGNVSLDQATVPFRKHPTYEQQLGWRTPSADLAVRPGSAGVLDLRHASGVPSPGHGECPLPDQALAGTAPACETVEQALVPVTVGIPSGPFIMGESPNGGNEGDRIDLPAYRIGLHPVTNAEYAQFVADGGYTQRWQHCWTSAGWACVQDYGLPAPKGWQEVTDARSNHPVVGVTWYEAWAYCAWLGEVSGRHFSLPTEAQWEKAARGTDGRRYPWGDKWEPGRCNSAESGLGRISPVLTHLEGNSPFGVTDMAGNVWEWCSSVFGSYPYRDDDGREDPSGVAVRAVRGGSWFVRHEFVRCAFRNHFAEGLRADHLGFRVAELV